VSPPLRASAQRRLVDAAVEEALDHTEGEPALRFRLRCPARLRSLFFDTVELARRVAGEALPLAQAAEAIAAEALSGAPRGDWAWQSPPAPATLPAPATTLLSAADSAPSRPGAAPAAPVVTASPLDLDARLRRAVAALRAVDGEIGRALVAMRARRLHRASGFHSFADYLRDRTGIAPRTARCLMAAERVASTSPALAAAYHAGELSWLQTLTLAPVVAHVPAQIAVDWVARAGRVTLRRLTDEVAWVLARRDTGEPGPYPPPPLDGELRREQYRQIGARSADSAEDPGAASWPELVAAEITFTGPASIVALLQTAIGAFAAMPYGSSPPEPRWRGCERLLRHVQATWLALPRHPDPIFARDDWRCAVPACSGRRNLHDHHVRFRSRGGDNRRTNRLTVCAWHHLRAIHRGLIRGWGTAPHGIRWQLGINHDGAGPLLELLGDRYLDDAEVMADRRIHQRHIATHLATWIPLDGDWEALRRGRA
jgi:hypothetical protein